MEKLLFTGGTGFLGGIVKPILDQSYDVTTIGITDRDVIKANLSDSIPELPGRYDVVLHAAGKAHFVPRTEEEKQSFYAVNYTGTIHLCKALERIGPPRALVFISTLSVYGSDAGNLGTEELPLKGDTPYADSKILAEQYLSHWCSSNDVILGILRPALLVGRGAPGNLGAMIEGIKKGIYFDIAGGKARKSMLMADDIARLVIKVADKGGTYNVCDSYNPSFRELSTCIANQLGKRKPLSIPYWVAKFLASIGDVIRTFPIDSERLSKIVTSDTWSNEKAKRELGWEPLDVLTSFKID